MSESKGVEPACALELKDTRNGKVYQLPVIEARVEGDTATTAGDDADEARWFAPEEVETLPCVVGLGETLRGWGVLEG